MNTDDGNRKFDIVIESLESVVGVLRIGFAVMLSLVVKLC